MITVGGFGGKRNPGIEKLTKKRTELFMLNFNDLHVGGETVQYLLAKAFSRIRWIKVPDNLEINISFQGGHSLILKAASISSSAMRP